MPYAKDFSKEVIPYYLGRIRTYFTKHLFIDIGTQENLAFARTKFKSIHK